jgi:apolipoprotein N-acyltransferase
MTASPPAGSICGIEAATPIEFRHSVYRSDQMLTTFGADLWPVRAAAVTPRRLMRAVTRARGRRRAWIALAAGAASALGQAPLHLWPILFLTFPLLVWLIDGAPAQRLRGAWVCALTGWCFGFGYFVACFYWFGYAFLVDAETFGWLLPVAVIGGPAYFAIYTAVGFAVAHLLWVRSAARILAFAVTLTGAEWLRGHALTGFPWNAFGYALASPLELAQSASVVGIWGLTFIAVAVFASPATLTDDRAEVARPWLPVLCALAILAALALFGSLRLSRTPPTWVDGVRLRVMQPNLQQDSKFSYSAKAQVMGQYITLSSRETDLRPRGLRDVTHLIWPESAFPFYLTTEPDALAQIASLLPKGTVLITGADRVGGPPPGAASTARIPRSTSLIITARCSRSMTRCTSSRSASISRFKVFSNAWACTSSPR